MSVATDRAEKELMQELKNQINIVHGYGGVALHNVFGWGAVRIGRLFDLCTKMWNEAAGERDRFSVLAHLYENTGIDMQLDGEPDWRTLIYLTDDESIMPDRMTDVQFIYMKHRQKRWLPVQLLAELTLALNVREGIGPERLSRFLEEYYRLRDSAPKGAVKNSKKAARRAADMLANEVGIIVRERET